MNKKADIASIIYIVIFIFVVGLVLFLVSHMNNLLFSGLENALGNSTTGTGTEALVVTSQIKASDALIWDYAFLGIFMGSLIAIGLSAYAVRISPVFFWIYGLLSLVVLALGVMLSNTWQSWAGSPEFATSILRFPITNMILGTWYPTIVTGILVVAMGLIFGKPREGV